MKIALHLAVGRRTHALIFVQLLAGGLMLTLAMSNAVADPSTAATPATPDPFARPTNVAARTHLEAGNRLFRVREFLKAVDEYKAGALQEAAPVFYHNLGQCYRLLGEYELAVWHYEKFLERGMPTGTIEGRIKDYIEQMRREIDRKTTSQSPIEPTAVRPATTRESLPELDPVPSRPTRLRRKLAIGTGIAGVASMSVGVGFWVRARSLEGDANRLCPMSTCEFAIEANRLVDRGNDYSRYSRIAIGVGGVVLLGAGVLWVTSNTPQVRGVALIPHMLPGVAGVTAAGAF